MFSRQDDARKCEGPHQSAIFTCVSGHWVGELGPWQYVGNLSCQDCIQAGTPSLGYFSSVSLAKVYFLEHRLVQVSYASSSSQGCLTASWPTRSPPVLQQNTTGQDRQVLLACGSQQIVLKTACDSGEEEASYCQDSDLFLRVEKREQNMCLFQRQNSLWLDRCNASALQKGRQMLVSDAGCVLVRGNGTDVITTTCHGGNCHFGMDMVDVADNKWNFSVPAGANHRRSARLLRRTCSPAAGAPRRRSPATL